ncbi:hypothetical protein, partial [Sphingomonas sp. ABOLF]|uniref:hypothetical protein n=1 Tax=Sphingomonas sp. ABOLF TaxID=1985879 RepID=UPI0019D219F8
MPIETCGIAKCQAKAISTELVMMRMQWIPNTYHIAPRFCEKPLVEKMLHVSYLSPLWPFLTPALFPLWCAFLFVPPPPPLP